MSEFKDHCKKLDEIDSEIDNVLDETKALKKNVFDDVLNAHLENSLLGHIERIEKSVKRIGYILNE